MNGDKLGWTPIHHAVKNGNIAEVERLLATSNVADVNASTTILSVPYYCGTTALHIVANSGGREITRLLIEHGAEINAFDIFRYLIVFVIFDSMFFPNLTKKTSLYLSIRGTLLFQNDTIAFCSSKRTLFGR